MPTAPAVVHAALINVKGNQLVYAKQLSGRDQAVGLFEPREAFAWTARFEYYSLPRK